MSPLLKRKNALKNEKQLLRQYCFVSAGLAALVMLIIYAFHDNTLLFGDLTVLRMDLYHQYGPLYAEVYDRITSGESLVYSWTSGLGASFLGNLFNYCSSPFALFMLICGHKNMPEAIALMIMAKAMLAASCCTYYINKSNKIVEKSSIVFGLFYAFSGYFVAYSWNIMWFDAVAVFPIVMLGLERIINKNKPGLYIAAMTYTMISNYYMAYMVCILSVIYFIYYFFGKYELASKIFRKAETAEAADETKSEETAEAVEVAEIIEEAVATENDENAFCEKIEASEVKEAAADKKNKKKESGLATNRFWVTGWSFALSSFLCFALAAFALLPVFFCLQSSSATADKAPETYKQYFDIFRFIANHLTGVEATIRSSGDNVIPNVYCGILTVILLPFYFLSDRIPGKQKIMSAVLLIICFAGFNLNIINFVLHGFHMPNDLPYRWSFAYSFFLIILAFKAFRNIDEFSNKAYIGMGFAVMCFIVLVEKFEVPNVAELTMILSVVFTILYIVVFGMFRSPRYRKGVIVLLLFFTVILEIVAADAPKLTMAQPKNAYTSDYEAYQQLSDRTEDGDSELFYRTELTKLRTRMDPSWYDYNGVSVFSSMAYERTAKTMEKMGLFGNNINSYTYYPQTTIFNSFFAVRYLYDNMDFIQNDDIYTLVDSNGDFEAYKYKYYLPLIFSVDEAVEQWYTGSTDPFVTQNNLMLSATGVEDVLIDVDATDFIGENIRDVELSVLNSGSTFTVSKTSNGSDGKATVKITPETEGNYYIYIGSTRISYLRITAKDLSYDYNSVAIEPFVLDLGYLTPEDEVSVTYTVPSSNNSATLTFAAARLDVEKFEEAYNKILENGTMDMTSFEETSLEGTINVTNDNPFLWTSIPYDESWEIILDGKVLTYSIYDEETGEITKEGDIIKLGGGLIGIRADKGEHTISMNYKARGLSTGIMLTVAGVVLLAAAIAYKRWFRKLFEKKGLVPVFFREPDFEND